MKIGFTGTRKGMSEYQLAVFEGLLEKMESFHHGSCQGADVEAARIVYSTFLEPPEIICHPGPNDDEHQELSGVDTKRKEPKTHFARNRDIVNETDKLIACPCDMTEQKRGGTWYTIRYAKKQGKPVTIIWPDGSISSL